MNESTYIAVMNLSAFNGIGIIDIEYGVEDYCICESFSPNEKKRTKNKIYTELKTDRKYIRKNGSRYYIDEFMKIWGVKYEINKKNN